jgi:hypothetical protein
MLALAEGSKSQVVVDAVAVVSSVPSPASVSPREEVGDWAKEVVPSSKHKAQSAETIDDVRIITEKGITPHVLRQRRGQETLARSLQTQGWEASAIVKASGGLMMSNAGTPS